jgi:NRAMP (natural resistance-associated macrophage protein)-like metal ion transporter
MSAQAKAPALASAARRIKTFFYALGPGLVTGCADDDPSGISTYSIAGAAFGYSTLWSAVLSFPLMASIQMMCGRLGKVTGHGLAEVIRLHFPKWVLWFACVLLTVANICNIAADLGGMSDVTQMVTGIGPMIWTTFYTVLITGFLLFSSYRRLAQIFKWTTLVLFAYVLAAHSAHADWHAALRATFIPHVIWSRRFFAIFEGILGTTVSPYLFFWQSSQEVEEDRSRNLTRRRRSGAIELRRLRADVITGMFVSNFVMYFIILTTAATLHANGSSTIETAREAADALRPLAGNAAYLLFSLGLIGTGLLGVPVLAGSCAYAIAEAASWRGSLDERRPGNARGFYGVLATAMIIGLAINLAHLDGMKMMLWAAILNGVLAPPLILLVILLTNNPKVMGARVNSPFARILGWITFAIMTAAALGMFSV